MATSEPTHKVEVTCDRCGEELEVQTNWEGDIQSQTELDKLKGWTTLKLHRHDMNTPSQAPTNHIKELCPSCTTAVLDAWNS